MCVGISGIIHYKRPPLFWLQSNSHTEILKHYKIKDDKPLELRRHVKFELHPLGSLTSTRPSDWRFVLDEDETPDWFMESDWADKCIRAGVKQIIREYIKNGCPCDLYLQDTPIKDLGQLKSVGGYLDLRNTPIKDLGQLQSVGGDLYLQGTPIKDLGQLQSVSVGGEIYRG